MSTQPEYFLAFAVTCEDLNAMVSERLQQGWRLQGSASVAVHIDTYEDPRSGGVEREVVRTFTQAMIRGHERFVRKIAVVITTEMVVLAHEEAGLLLPAKLQNTRSNVGKTGAHALADALNKIQQHHLDMKGT